MKPVMTMLPHPDPSPNGQPQVFIEARCDHGALLFTYESDEGHTFDEIDQRGLAIGKAHAMALQVLRCPCWREGSRTAVGMPDEWQQAGLGPLHHRWADA